MTVAEFVGYRAAAEYLGISQDTLRQRVWQGTGPEPEMDRAAVPRMPPQLVFTGEELDRWLDDLPAHVRKKLVRTNRTTRPTTEDRPMLRRNTRTQPAKKATDPRADLVKALAESGTPVASACGMCGATVRTDDPEAVQAERNVGTWPYVRRVRSWRYHGVCELVARQGSPALLAFVLAPQARPIRVTQAHHDVAQKLGAPLTYRELEKASHTDRGTGRGPFQHVKRAELEELRAAVAQRHQELTVPVPHSSGYPCGVCGRSHELKDAWGEYQGRPVCGPCSSLIERAKAPGNPELRDYAWESARAFLPPRGVARFLLAREVSSYRPLGPGERREPWAYAADLPEVPLTDEERLAALLAEAEARLAGAAA